MTREISKGVAKTPNNTIIGLSAKDFRLSIKDGGELNDLPLKIITTGVDTEYVQRPDHPNKMLTTQLALSKGLCGVWEYPTLNLDILPSWNGRCILSSVLDYPEVHEPESVDGYLLWEILMFFAPADLLGGLFNDFELCRYIQRYCQQDARIRIETEGKKNKDLLPLDIFLQTPDSIYQVIIKVVDFGKISVGGLADVVQSFGGRMLEKGLMDNYKTNMEIPYTHPDLFDDYIKYAKDDAQQLFFLREANKERTKKLFDIHGLETPEKEIVTTGALVAKLFEAYLREYIGENEAYKYFTKTKWGKEKDFDLLDLLHKSTVDYFASRKDTRKQANALIQGGRAKNERPTVINADGVIADPDLSSCYVTILRNLIYPVGLPCTYGQHESSKKKMTLGKFLKKFGDELEPRLYATTVSGVLKHHQTLVPSKVIDNLEITEKYSEDDPKIPADFRLYTKEIINGVITSDVLDVINNVCNTRERKEWMNLEVVSAIWYPKSKRCETPLEWLEKTRLHTEETGNDIKTKVTSSGKEIIQDDRSRYWLTVPIEDFLKPYAEMRKSLKSEMKTHPKGSERYSELNAQQQAMKLVGNTLYGVLASPYFDIGNVAIANNITAAARVAVWCTAVAAGSFQSITDGGAFDLNKVRDWKNNKPSMNTLSLWRNTKLINNRITRDLFEKSLASNSEWVIEPVADNPELTKVTNGDIEIIASEGKWTFFDEELLNHVRRFFRDGSEIDILNVISYEHKDIYSEIVLHSQTNYRFRHVSGEYKIKARGHKIKGTPYNNDTEPSNITALFDCLKHDATAIPPYRPQTISQVLKCNQANDMLEAKTDNILKQNNLLAGDSILKQSWVRPISLSMFHWQTDKQYKSWCKKSDSLKNRTGWGIEQFFINEDGSTNYQSAIETVQARIDEGKEWIIDSKAGQSYKTENFNNHPFKPENN